MDECQNKHLEAISQGTLKVPPLPVFSRLKLAVRRRLSPKAFRSVKRVIDSMVNKTGLQRTGEKESLLQNARFELLPGDRVRIRSRSEIEALLNRWKETRHCGFMDGMWQYCDTIQIVKQPVRRFVEERTLEIKKTSGIVILENVFCGGTTIFGDCDRSCYFFWRVEWLEKL